MRYAVRSPSPDARTAAGGPVAAPAVRRPTGPAEGTPDDEAAHEGRGPSPSGVRAAPFVARGTRLSPASPCQACHHDGWPSTTPCARRTRVLLSAGPRQRQRTTRRDGVDGTARRTSAATRGADRPPAARGGDDLGGTGGARPGRRWRDMGRAAVGRDVRGRGGADGDRRGRRRADCRLGRREAPRAPCAEPGRTGTGRSGRRRADPPGARSWRASGPGERRTRVVRAVAPRTALRPSRAGIGAAIGGAGDAVGRADQRVGPRSRGGPGRCLDLG